MKILSKAWIISFFHSEFKIDLHKQRKINCQYYDSSDQNKKYLLTGHFLGLISVKYDNMFRWEWLYALEGIKWKIGRFPIHIWGFLPKNVIYILTGMIYCINITLRKMYLRRISNGKFLRLTILGNFCLIF